MPYLLAAFFSFCYSNTSGKYKHPLQIHLRQGKVAPHCVYRFEDNRKEKKARNS